MKFDSRARFGLVRRFAAVVAAFGLAFACASVANAQSIDDPLTTEELQAAEAAASGVSLLGAYDAYWAWPLPAYGTDHISQGFENHGGIDIWAPEGTPIVASRDGVVSSVETTNTLNGYGICVVVYHFDGTTSYYAHMSARAVEDGDCVSAGQTLGYVGSTGWSTGNHLHFEIRTDTTEDWIWGTRIDPLPLVTNGSSTNPVVASGDYYDVDYNDASCWYASYVQKATELGLMAGRGNGLFDPEGTVTRGEALTVLYRSATNATADDAYAQKNTTPFSDNEPGQFYTAALNWAWSAGVLQGDGSKARPDDQITREELATWIARYASNVRGVVISGDAWALGQADDVEQVSPWALEALSWTSANDILSGRGTETGCLLAPADSATRAETSKIMVRTVEVLG